MKREIYHVAIPLTKTEKDTLLKEAGKRGLDVGAFLAGVIGDMGNGPLRAYLDEERPGPESFVRYCIRKNEDMDYLEYAIKAIRCHEKEMAKIRKKPFSEEARSEYLLHQEVLEDCQRDKDAVWEGYLEEAGARAMSEKDAIKEAKEWNTTGRRRLGSSIFKGMHEEEG